MSIHHHGAYTLPSGWLANCYTQPKPAQLSRTGKPLSKPHRRVFPEIEKVLGSMVRFWRQRSHQPASPYVVVCRTYIHLSSAHDARGERGCAARAGGQVGLLGWWCVRVWYVCMYVGRREVSYAGRQGSQSVPSVDMYLPMYVAVC